MRLSHLAVISAVTLAFCASCKGTENSAEAEADVTAAQIEGRNEAKRFINRPWKDTMELQDQLLEARVKQSKYAKKGNRQAAAAYDSAFVSTLRTVRPELAVELDKAKNR